MIKETLFLEFERELRLDQLGDVLQKLEKNINFNKISQKLMLPHHDEPPQDVPISYRADGCQISLKSAPCLLFKSAPHYDRCLKR